MTKNYLTKKPVENTKTLNSIKASLESLNQVALGLKGSRKEFTDAMRSFILGTGLESIEDSTTVSEFNNDYDRFANQQRQGDENGEVEYSEAQLEAGRQAGLASANRGDVATARAEQPAATDARTQVVMASDDQGALPVNPEDSAATEAYDNSENAKATNNTITYNLHAAKQSDFMKAVWPMIVASADTPFVVVTAELMQVHNFYRRKTTHVEDHKRYNRPMNLIRALIDPTILHHDSTLNVPVYRQSDTESHFAFVESSVMEPYEHKLEDGTVIKTAPLSLKNTKPFDILKLSATDELLGNNGYLNETDSLDPRAALRTLYMKVGNQIIKFENLEMLAGSSFVASSQYEQREMVLDFRHDVLINKNTKTVDKQAITGMDSNENTVRMNLQVNIQLNLADAVVTVVAANCRVSRVNGPNRETLPLTEGNGQTTANIFAQAELVGFDLTTRRHNRNLRERGQLIESHRYQTVYSLGRYAPISCIRPVSDSDNQDANRLDMLTRATRIRSENAGITALFDVDNYLSSTPVNPDPSELFAQKTLGMGRFFLRQYYKRITLDIQKEMNTLRSADQIVDAHAVFINTIRDAVYNMWVESDWIAANSVLYGNDNRPNIVVATDPILYSYLFTQGDTRTLGNGFDFETVFHVDERMRGKMFLIIGSPKGAPSDMTNPIHFGNAIYRPEIPSIMVVDRESTTSHELTVQPSITYIPHAPVLVRIDVTGLSEAVAKGNAFNVKTHSD